ncbi:cytidylate kinase [Alteribacillus persepolensis]|uniref:Cytidylate kinase n=1 Tax=Alteribacillus persepolensis TaxID=568899 RepID=A0A1G7ZI73_9BACI|nr:(d)CMP kinase [Alteribacillus persepolensis]SDH08277.1 cytidylate kinase [Alteribacillus persepolensis]
MNKINIAIDGPAGAGKSTVAKQVARDLDYTYIDTGAMYRALAWKALQSQADIQDGEALSALLESMDLTLSYTAEGNRIFVDNEEVTNMVRSNEVTASVSQVSLHAGVREQMVKKQQELAKAKGTVLDGRDIGTTVLPHAELKVFLTASVEERARRRHLENVENGRESNFETIKQDIQTRDEKDSSRLVSPLTKAADAVEMDTTELTAEQAAMRICSIAKERIKKL